MAKSMKFNLVSEFNRIALAAKRAEAKMLNHVGGYIRKTAVRSIRKGIGKKSSMPGMPPFTWIDVYPASIQYAYDSGTSSVVVGGVPFKGSTIPGVIEYGGTEIITQKRSGTRKIGKYAPRPAMRIALKKAIDLAVAAALRDYITP